MRRTKLGKPVIVDPKNANFSVYRGATLLTPNRKEFAEATRSRAETDLKWPPRRRTRWFSSTARPCW